jgi:hypothetical protein
MSPRRTTQTPGNAPRDTMSSFVQTTRKMPMRS